MRNQRGYVTVLTMVLGAICAFLLMQMVSYSVASRKQIIITRDIARYSSILDSMLDYTTYGIKNRWCFNALWLQEDPGACNLGNIYSTEALLLNNQSLKALRDYARLKGTLMPAIHTSRFIRTTVRVQDIANGHPLFKAINGLSTANKDVISSIEFEVERLENEKYPTRGGEAAIRITAKIHAGSNLTIFGNANVISATSLILVTPRELAYFSMIIPQDLRLDAGTVNASGIGDLNIPIGTEGEGITFQSPVFVNRDIYLPPTGTYTSANFLNKVYIGKGSIYQDGRLHGPATPGGQGHQYYTELSTFGGFSRGIDIDGAQDQGLLYLANLVTGGGAPSNVDMMDECRKISNAEMDLSLTKRSDLLIRLGGVTPPSLLDSTFILGLSGRNRFALQGYEHYRLIGSSGPKPITNPDSLLRPAAVLKIKIEPHSSDSRISSKVYEYELGRNSTVSTKMGAGVELEIKTSDSLVTKGVPPLVQQNLVGLNIKFGPTNISKLDGANVTIDAHDIAVFGGADRRRLVYESGPSDTYETGYSRQLSFTYNTSGPVLSGNNTNAGGANGPVYLKLGPWSSPPPEPPFPESIYPGNKSYEEFRNTCLMRVDGAPISSSFQPGAWGEEGFLDAETRNAWSFTYKNPPDVTIDIDADSTLFDVHSIGKKCIVENTVKFFAGFLVCDEFIIRPRAEKLKIVGTIIANKTVIDPSAVKAGIKFMSIYHPAAVYELRNHGILKDFAGNNCPLVPPTPVWHPEPSIKALYDQFNCSTSSLRSKADPFTWTTVSPDCGTRPGETVPTCLRRPRHFLVREISRQSDLQ